MERSTYKDKKVIDQFSAKMVKSKVLYDSTTATCQKLRRQAKNLEEQLKLIQSQRKAAQVLQQGLSQQLALNNDNLTKQKEKVKAQTLKYQNLKKDIANQARINSSLANNIDNENLQLKELQNRRAFLENQAETLAQNLKQITVQRQKLQAQNEKTINAKNAYKQNINDLKNQLYNMTAIIKNNSSVHNKNQEIDD